jgi:hypothetical protein
MLEEFDGISKPRRQLLSAGSRCGRRYMIYRRFTGSFSFSVSFIQNMMQQQGKRNTIDRIRLVIDLGEIDSTSLKSVFQLLRLGIAI